MIGYNNKNLNLGTWQGIYLGEHRDNASRREIVMTVIGEWGDDYVCFK